MTLLPGSVSALGARRAAAVYLAALLPRLALALVFLSYPIGLDDMFQYDMLARSLVQGSGYRWYGRADAERMRPYLEEFFGIDLDTVDLPQEGLVSTFRPPGYPAFLAGIYAASGFEGRLEAARLVQVVLGAALAPMTAVLAMQLGFPRRISTAAGVAVALYPILWMYPIGLASENTYIPLTTGTLIAALWAADRRRPAAGLVPGLALGAATLTRGAFGAALPLVALWLGRRATWRHAAAFCLAAAASLVPWVVRNSIVLGRPSYVDNSAGFNLYMGYHPQGDGGFAARAGVQALRILDDGERDDWTRAQALRFIRSDPGRIPELLTRRVAYFLGWEDQELTYFYSNGFFGPIPQPWLLLAYLVIVTPWMAVALGATGGLALAPGRGRGSRWLILAICAATFVPYILVLAEPRFHVPLVPLLAPYAAWFWSQPGERDRLRSLLASRSPAALAAAAVAFLLVASWAWDFARESSEFLALMSPGGHALKLDY